MRLFKTLFPQRKHLLWLPAIVIVFFAVASGLVLHRGSFSPAPPPNPSGMVKIPAGAFLMGIPPSGVNLPLIQDQKPQKRVSVDAFWLDVHEVTVAQYAECVDAGICREPRAKKPGWGEEKWSKYDFAYNWGKKDRRNHPVNGVDWYNADAYCRWKGKHLPTEAQFEKALRDGIEGALFPWGDTRTPPPGFGNYADQTGKERFDFWFIFKGYEDGFVATAPVCSFKKNSFGLCDISGNVSEWCWDFYQKDWFARMPGKNPINTDPSTKRVIKGGGWRGVPLGNLASHRTGLDPKEYLSSRGFRCAWGSSLEEETETGYLDPANPPAENP